MSIEYIIPTLKTKLPYYEKIDDLSGGAVKVKEAGKTYLPEESGESDLSYKSRLSKATYFDTFNSTVDGLSGLIFKKPITYSEDIPTQLEPMIENADAQGNHMDVLIEKFFVKALQKGISFALIDSPKAVDVKTKADEQAQGIKPYITIINAENVTSWKTTTVNGQLILSQVKIREFIQVDDETNPYETKTIEQYRVLEIGTYQIWQNKEGKDILIEEGTTNLNFIPLVALNLENDEYFSAMPPFMDLAELNIAHYQIFSDSRHSAHIASVPMLKMFGFDAEELKSIVISANRAVTSTNTDATVEWLDYKGEGVAVNETLLAKIETKMREMGLSVISQDKTLTATEVNISSAQSQSKLNGYVRALIDSVELIFQMAARMYGVEDGGSIYIDADILTQPLQPADVLALNTMVVSGNMSIDTMFKIIASGSFRLGDDFDIEVEKETISKDGLLTNDTER
jgi:hypothetical protein